MGFLDSVVKGPQQHPPRLLIYGPEGTGKSSIGAALPSTWDSRW